MKAFRPSRKGLKNFFSKNHEATVPKTSWSPLGYSSLLSASSTVPPLPQWGTESPTVRDGGRGEIFSTVVANLNMLLKLFLILLSFIRPPCVVSDVLHWAWFLRCHSKALNQIFSGSNIMSYHPIIWYDIIYFLYMTHLVQPIHQRYLVHLMHLKHQIHRHKSLDSPLSECSLQSPARILDPRNFREN